MRNYRDYLNERKVPAGPWCVLELHNVRQEQLKKPMDKSA